VQLIHASNGVVMLDRESKRWQIGWADVAAEYTLQRAPAR
jgi:hypothetical protein